MNNKIYSEKNCKNCKYFHQYYIKTDTKYKPVQCGICKSGHLKWNEKRKVPFVTGCEKWQLKEEINECNQNILKVLQDMEKHLKEMIIILKDE